MSERQNDAELEERQNGEAEGTAMVVGHGSPRWHDHPWTMIGIIVTVLLQIVVGAIWVGKISTQMEYMGQEIRTQNGQIAKLTDYSSRLATIEAKLSYIQSDVAELRRERDIRDGARQGNGGSRP